MAGASTRTILHGSCSCGETKYTIRPFRRHETNDGNAATPASNLVLSAYCHCTSCQRLSSCPFIWTAHWRKEAVEFTTRTPDEYILPEKPHKHKLRCRTCGTPLGTWNEQKQEWSTNPATLDRDETGIIIGLEFVRATAHQFYTTRVLDVKGDGLSKWTGYEGSSQRLPD